MTNRVVNVPINYSDLHLACSVLFRAMMDAQVKANTTARAAINRDNPCHEYSAKVLELDEKEAREAAVAYEALNAALSDATLVIRPDGYLFAEEFQM